MATKESFYIRKESIFHRTGLEHRHGRRFIILEHQYGRRDVMWKRFIFVDSSASLASGSKGQSCAQTEAQAIHCRP